MFIMFVRLFIFIYTHYLQLLLIESRPNFTENAYQNQKKKIKDILDIRKFLKSDEKNNEENIINLPNFGLVIFNDINDCDKTGVINWEYAFFLVENSNCEETPKISIYKYIE